MTLLSFIVCLFPLALPRFHFKNSSTPFPCQNCACGCKTPEQCWTHCCCYSPKERAAWAKEHGVTPPSYAILNESDSSSSTKLIASGERTEKACCSTSNKPSCCNVSSKNPSPAKSGHCCTKPKSKTEKLSYANEEGKSSFILVVQALKCHGITFGFSALPVFEWSLTQAITILASHSESIPIENFIPLSAFDPVPSPPPKL